MNAPPPSAVRLLGVLVLAGLLVLGRTALSAHAYEHDLAEGDHDCEFCEIFHVSGKDAIPGSGDGGYSADPADRPEVPGAALLRPISPTVRARGPPPSSVERSGEA